MGTATFPPRAVNSIFCSRTRPEAHGLSKVGEVRNFAVGGMKSDASLHQSPEADSNVTGVRRREATSRAIALQVRCVESPIRFSQIWGISQCNVLFLSLLTNLCCLPISSSTGEWRTRLPDPCHM